MDRSTFLGFYGKSVYQVELEIALMLYIEWAKTETLKSERIGSAAAAEVCHELASEFIDYWLTLPIPKVDK